MGKTIGTTPPRGAPGTSVRETEGPGSLPHLVRPDWVEGFPWLVHGITHRGSDGAGDGSPGFDLRLRGPAAGEAVLGRWDELRTATGMDTVVHARQVHGRAIRAHRGLPPGLVLVPECDGHLTADRGLLLTVSVADCVPIFLVAPASRVVALVHAGWRGVAAGIAEEAVAAFRIRHGIRPGELHVHLGPAISGPRYEVGPEVHAALARPDPGGPAELDLRAEVARRLVALGVPQDRIGSSIRCTHDDPLLFSHRGGDGARQVAFLGLISRSGAVR